MRTLDRARQLPGAEWRLLFEAAGLVTAIRVALWLLPFPTAWRLARRLGRGRERGAVGGIAGHSEARLVWAVGVAGRLVPRSTCLVRALASRALLARHGWASEVRLGVARGPDGALQAHAWLEREGRVLIGGAVDERYVPLPSIEHHG